MFKRNMWFKGASNHSDGHKNPWLGLATYATEDADRFKGREKASNNLFSMIDNNLVVTLYGKSGIGKSSLINAGVVPMLNSVGYRVVVVNIREMKAASSGNDSIYTQAIRHLQKMFGVELETIDDSSLWRILHNKGAFGEIKEYPVLIFDQFEELFLDTNNKDADLFVGSISKLTDSGFYLEDEGVISNNKYRILLSLREDDLFRLEDSIDRNGYTRLKDNRYRLQSLTQKEAESIIATGKDYFDDYDKCYKEILDESKESDGSIDTATLSLLCHRLFEKARKNPENIIHSQAVSKEKDPLYQLYKEEVGTLRTREQLFIENNLITSSGRRDVVSKAIFDRKIKSAPTLLTNSDSHVSLFRVIDNGNNVELIHDSLAKAIYKKKEERSQNIEKVRRRVMDALLVILSLAPLIYACYKCIWVNATTTNNNFNITHSYWGWILLSVPLLNCYFVTKEKRWRKLLVLAIVCYFMALNNGLFFFDHKIYHFNDSILSSLGRNNVPLQLILLAVFVALTFTMFNDKDKVAKIISRIYLNLVTFICVFLGFGYNIFSIHNEVSSDGRLFAPWCEVVHKQGDNYGLVDWMGNQILPCVFDSVYTLKSTGNLVKQVRSLGCEDTGAADGFPLRYSNGKLTYWIAPQFENQVKKLARSKVDEDRLKASVFKKSRDRIIFSFSDNQLYDSSLVKDIENLYDIQIKATYDLLSLLNSKSDCITDEQLNSIRIRLSDCICTLHMLETFGKKSNIKDDDIAQSIFMLTLFSAVEVLDNNVRGINTTFNSTDNINLDIFGNKFYSSSSSIISGEGYLAGNKQDVYNMFNKLCWIDISLHVNSFQELMDQWIQNSRDFIPILHQQITDLDKYSNNHTSQDLLSSIVPILLEQSSNKAKINKIKKMHTDMVSSTDSILAQTEVLLDSPLFVHNQNKLLNYDSVVSPLIQCIKKYDVPDKTTALTDIVSRLLLMGIFRGWYVHDYIEQLDTAYNVAMNKTIRSTFEFMKTLDSTETEILKVIDDSKNLVKTYRDTLWKSNDIVNKL